MHAVRAAPVSAAGLTDGSVVGPFEIRGRLGRGGMGVVYRAYDRRHHGEVALKLLAEHVAGDDVFGERFRRGARAAFVLRNPYVVPVHDFGEVDGRLYISMQLVDGRDLAAVLEDGPLTPARAVGILRQAAHALDAAHRANLIHRDVKPSNLLVLDHHDDFTYLVDFGIAHVVGTHTVGTSLTSTGATIGTLAYMAPERLDGSGVIDGRVDVYALACVLFQMLTGRAPYPQTDQPALIAAHLFGPVPRVTDVRPDLPRAWDDVIARGMAKKPDERHPTAQALADDARRVLDGQPPAAPAPPTAGPEPVRPVAPPTQVPDGWRPSVPATHVPGPAPLPPTHVRAAHHAVPPPWGTPPDGTHPGPVYPPRRGAGTGVAVAIGLVTAVAIAAVVWLVGQGSGNAEDRADAAPPTSAPRTSVAPTSVAPPTAPTVTDPGLPPVLQPQSVPPSPSAGDLGLSRPLTRVACTGGYAVFVGSSVDPAVYRTQVQEFLTRFPGSSYLLSEQNCTSLRHTTNGNSIYSVYYGPYPTLDQACAARSRAGGDSYVRRLDDSTPVGVEPAC